MADFNKVLDPGDVDGGLVNTAVEIPEGSRLKVGSAAGSLYAGSRRAENLC